MLPQVLSFVTPSCIFPNICNGAGSTPGILSNRYGVISNSEISHNFETGQGGESGGIQNLGKMKVINCDIHANNTNGITVIITGGLFNIVVIVTGADGGGILHAGDSLFVEDCRIYGNRAAGGGGVAVRNGYALIRNSYVTNNFSAYGAACYNEKNLEMRNCVIANNMSYSEGILKNVGASSTRLINTTLTNNTRYSSQQTNALLFHGGSQNLTPNHFKLSNCIVKNSFGLTGYYTGATGTDTINYSCVPGGFSGVGNLNSEPMFLNPTAGNDTTYNAIHANWSLSACSPCINSGSDSLTTDSLDLTGNIRKYNTVDMGALELKYDTSVTALWSGNIAETAATIHWSRSVKPCETVVFIKDTVAGSPIPVPGMLYNADTVFGSGSNLDGWYCLYKGMDSTVNVSGLTGATTYRVAVFNVILDSIYDVPARMNFTTPGSVPPIKIVANDTIVGGEGVCYNANITLTVAGNGMLFRVDDGGSVTLISGQKILLLPGVTVVSGGYLHATIAPNGPWCYDTKSASASPNLEPETSNLEPETLNLDTSEVFRVKAWPNPVSDILNVSWNGNDQPEGTMLEIRNLFGKPIFSTIIKGNDHVFLSLKNLPPAMYLLHVVQGGKSTVVKVVKD